METLEAIRTRRSIRQFEDRAIPEPIIRELLAAAMNAPSAGNQQPWHFVVIDDRQVLEQVPGLNPYAAMAPRAPLAILVCGDPDLEKFPGYWVQDCSAATQNLLLAAHAMGLGAVWTGVFPMKDRVEGFRALCGIPLSVIPMAFVVLGYPAQSLKPESRFNDGRIHRNRW